VESESPLLSAAKESLGRGRVNAILCSAVEGAMLKGVLKLTCFSRIDLIAQAGSSSLRLAESRRAQTRSRRCLRLQLGVLLMVSGCSRFHPKPPSESVYVMAKQTFLRDKVAAISNRVGTVQNGEQLTVLERGRRFLRVKTAKGEVGWIEERAVVPPATVTGFQDLARQHAGDVVVATAVLRDDLYMHLRPGRDTERFYLLPENERLQLLVRASVPKAQPPQASAVHTPSQVGKGKAVGLKGGPGTKAASGQAVGSKKGVAQAGSAAAVAAVAESPAMEDWWLTRDTHGRVGWLLARRVDVDAPDSIAGYAEGQRMVGAYVLTKVTDPDSSLPGGQVPVYVSVLSPFQDGLPYDFDQVRVFTWNLKKHRYETAYRQRNLQGYLPVLVKVQTFDKQGPVPTFQFQQGIGDGVITDPQTGAIKAAQSETETYRLDGVIVKKVVVSAVPGGVSQNARGTRAPSHARASRARGRRGKAGAGSRHRRTGRGR
jgi:Bacterial SH3 domain